MNLEQLQEKLEGYLAGTEGQPTEDELKTFQRLAINKKKIEKGKGAEGEDVSHLMTLLDNVVEKINA